MNFYLDPDIKRFLSPAVPLFEQMMVLRGEVFRSQKGRVTQRIVLGGKSYFIKQHHGVGWKEIFKNLLCGRLPVLGAKNEWLALEKLRSLGVAVPRLVGYGELGKNPASRRSFVLMEEVKPALSLEDICLEWKKKAPNVLFKRRLIKQVAKIARTLHENGVNHRDFYICHFLMLQDNMLAPLRLIDLHRAQIRAVTPLRWKLKDLAGLYFSSKDARLTQRDYFRFIKVYTGKTLRDLSKTDKSFWNKVKNRGNKLYQDHQ